LSEARSAHESDPVRVAELGSIACGVLDDGAPQRHRADDGAGSAGEGAAATVITIAAGRKNIPTEKIPTTQPIHGLVRLTREIA
jgi:hypothetical protein